MTDHGNRRRGLIRYCVSHPEDKNRTPFFVVLGHTRERAVLEVLIRAGAAGCSFYEAPAPRWAAVVHRLRKRGIDIFTIWEPHGGEHSGTHARYFLRSDVRRAPEEGTE